MALDFGVVMAKKHGNGKIISDLFTAAIDPTKLPNFLDAWDEYVLDPVLIHATESLHAQVQTHTLYEHTIVCVRGRNIPQGQSGVIIFPIISRTRLEKLVNEYNN